MSKKRRCKHWFFSVFQDCDPRHAKHWGDWTTSVVVEDEGVATAFFQKATTMMYTPRSLLVSWCPWEGCKWLAFFGPRDEVERFHADAQPTIDRLRPTIKRGIMTAMRMHLDQDEDI